MNHLPAVLLIVLLPGIASITWQSRHGLVAIFCMVAWAMLTFKFIGAML